MSQRTRMSGNEAVMPAFYYSLQGYSCQGSKAHTAGTACTFSRPARGSVSSTPWNHKNSLE